MIGRILTFARRAVGLALLAWAAWVGFQVVASWWAFRILGNEDPQVAVDADTGERYGFQVSPLTPSQRQAALEREAAIAAALA